MSALVDARTGVVYASTDELMAEIERLADQREDRVPKCEHGRRVRCTKCEKPEPPRRHNTWSDEREPPARDPALEEVPT